jgi:serralysin
MAILVSGGSFPLRFDELDLSILLEGEIISSSSTSVTIEFDDGFREIFTGFGILYDGFGIPRGGTLTGYRETLDGVTTFEVTGLNFPVSTFVAAVESGSTIAALSGLLSGNDNLTGTAFDDIFVGYDGHDNLFGGAGADGLAGGTGNDHLYGQSPNGGADGADLILGNSGSDYIQGNMGDDTLDGGDGSDRIQGGQGNDLIAGSEGNDSVNGNLGGDTISGDAGNDSLRGGQGNDSVSGGDDNDILSGDLGADTLTGGAGSDLFQFSGQGSLVASPDRVADFTDGADRLSVGYAPVIVLTAGAQASASAAATLAQQLFDSNAGTQEVAAIGVGADTYLFYSSNGGATADSAVLLANLGSSAITDADFG